MTRILFAFVAACLLVWGAFSCSVGEFGPILGGIMFIMLGLVILALIGLSFCGEQIMNDTDPFADIEEIDIDEDRL